MHVQLLITNVVATFNYIFLIRSFHTCSLFCMDQVKKDTLFYFSSGTVYVLTSFLQTNHEEQLIFLQQMKIEYCGQLFMHYINASDMHINGLVCDEEIHVKTLLNCGL